MSTRVTSSLSWPYKLPVGLTAPFPFEYPLLSALPDEPFVRLEERPLRGEESLEPLLPFEYGRED